MDSNYSEEDGITINETFIKMEPMDSKDDIDLMTVDDTGRNTTLPIRVG